MRLIKHALVVTALAGAAACGGDRTPPLQQAARPADVAWIDSLIAQPAPGLATASATELGLAAKDSAEEQVEAPVVTEPKRSTTSSSSRRSSTSSRRSSSGGSGTYSAPARQGRVVVQRNTTRDAAIGAGAGAVIGAVAGGRRHRVRNAVVGAVVGGAAGAVIGHHVDKRTRIEY